MTKIDEAIDRWAKEILPSKSEFKKALSRKKLTIYHGVDPTGPDLHLGHSTNYLLMRALQDAGHKIILLIGDFTARIGDPSDKTAARRRLSQKEITANLKTYKEQAGKILRFTGRNAVTIKFNSEWLSSLTFRNIIELAAEFTVQQMIERDIFQRRLAEKKPLYLHEFLYPLAQGYDSVSMKVDAEIGGTDQTFNMLVGRTLVKNHLGKEKFVITTPLLINPKTKSKMMSKSEGSYISLNDSPSEMYGKTMALPDETIIICLVLCTTVPLNEIQSIKRSLREGKANPLDAKKRLAWGLVKMHHSRTEADETQKEFEKTFQKRSPEYKTKIAAKPTLLATVAEIIGSVSQAKRLIKQGAVDIDGTTVSDPAHQIKGGEKIKIGKKTFVKVKK